MAPPLSPPSDATTPRPSSSPSRRRFLQVGGGSALGLALAACASDTTTGTGASTTAAVGPTSAPPTSSGTDQPGNGTGTALTVADFEGLATCVLLPEQTPGPFPLDEQFDRSDITEGLAGRSMQLGFRVVDDTCSPVPGAAVEVWHCDATGDYSAFEDGGSGKDEGPGTTFLRGTQIADADGIVVFTSIVPGWYEGRAVHIHLRVRVDDATVLTSQVYFDPAHLEAAYAAAPYAERGLPDTSNADDGIAGDVATNGTLLATRDATSPDGRARTVALLNLGVDPTS